VRGSLADRVAGLGHVSAVFDLLKRSAKHDPRGLGVAKMSCVRVVHQIAESRCVVHFFVALSFCLLDSFVC
jgi:hypothetical protein